MVQARAMAHYMARNTVKGYIDEQIAAKAKRDADKPKGEAGIQPEWSKFRMGGGVEHHPG